MSRPLSAALHEQSGLLIGHPISRLHLLVLGTSLHDGFAGEACASVQAPKGTQQLREDSPWDSRGLGRGLQALILGSMPEWWEEGWGPQYREWAWQR